MQPTPPLAWLEPGQAFPETTLAWNDQTPASGLLAAGGSLDAATLREAYSQGIFPWFSDGQPTLWWAPNPRMVLNVDDFKLHPSFRKTLRRFTENPRNEVRFDCAFERVIHACANTSRPTQSGTWIVPAITQAYGDLHRQGIAHSVETWINGELAGGLYCVGLGKYVFGESMFSKISNASKIALAALICFCREHRIVQIDCQQHTRHLESLGAKAVARSDFERQLDIGLASPPPSWTFAPLYWSHLIPSRPVES